MVCYMTIALFDMNREISTLLKEWMTDYSIRADCELLIYVFYDNQAFQKMEKYASEFQLAFISLHQKHAVDIGKRIYLLNPDCRICYYKDEPVDLYNLLSSRPIEFFCMQEGRDNFIIKLNRMLIEIQNSNSLFQYDGRGELLQCWKRNILYAHSDLKHICIKCIDETEQRFYAKLTDIENQLSPNFIRIHKSYIVNRLHLVKLDKKKHVVLLTNGEELPVSDAHYQQTVSSLKN